MSPVQSYRNLFSLTGPLYIVVAFLGRLPLAMSQVASLIAVSAASGTYAAGGITAGALAVANAVGAPLAGALSDRIGQRPVLLVQSVLGAAGLGALAWLTAVHQPGARWVLLPVVAAFAGFFTPQVGTMARVRWRPISVAEEVRDPKVMVAAFSYEGAADEASFVLGPALVGVVAALVAPITALVVAAALLGAFGTWFALHPTVRLVGPARAAAASTGKLLTPALLVLAFCQLSVGMVFGSVQTGTSVLATQAGQPGLTGLLHGLLGVGSVAAGLAIVALPERFGLANRLRWFTVALLVLALPLLLVGNLLGLCFALLGLGLAVAPTMITTFTLAERIAPPSRIGAAMTLLAAMTGAGYAAGAAVAGRLADSGGHQPAFGVSIAATVLATALAVGGFGVLRRESARAEADAVAEDELVPVP